MNGQTNSDIPDEARGTGAGGAEGGPELADRDKAFAREIGEKELRRLRARKKGENTWFGLGMFGLVGWSFAIPVLLFLALGIWIDSVRQTVYSWTLMMLGVGVVAGGANAWFWVRHEEKRIEEENNGE